MSRETSETSNSMVREIERKANKYASKHARAESWNFLGLEEERRTERWTRTVKTNTCLDGDECSFAFGSMLTNVKRIEAWVSSVVAVVIGVDVIDCRLLLSFVPRVVLLKRWSDGQWVYPFGSGTKCRSKPSEKTRRATEFVIRLSRGSWALMINDCLIRRR